jgi:hypothetical protein
MRQRKKKKRQSKRIDLRNQLVETQYVAGRDIHIGAYASNNSPFEMHNRKIMLDRVEQIWIKTLLEKSLHMQAPIALTLHMKPDVIDNLWYPVVQEMHSNRRSSSSIASITHAYDNASGALLILGEPGSGKTTLLLELTRNLLDRARQDDAHPIPMVFNLSSWSLERKPLKEWFIEELFIRYQVQRQVSQSWIESNQVLPLLDGLDEVAWEARSTCVNVINTYRKMSGLTPLVVCCRNAEYESLVEKKKRLRLLGAIAIQPLTEQQLDDYLSQAGEQFVPLRTALHTHVALQKLMESPLIFSIMLQIYQREFIEELGTTVTVQELQRQIFDAYIQHMFERRGAKAYYTPQQAVYWLICLAKQLVRHNQTELYIEYIQPSWLLDARVQKHYYSSVKYVITTANILLKMIIFGFLSGLLFVLLPDQILSSLKYISLVPLVNSTAFGMYITLMILALTLTIQKEVVAGRIEYNLLIKPVIRKIEPVEVVHWSWRTVWAKLLQPAPRIIPFRRTSYLLVSMILGFQIGSVRGIEVGLTSTILLWLTTCWLTIKLHGVIGGGFDSKKLDTNRRIRPNQGIRRSLLHSIFIFSLHVLGGTILFGSIGSLVGILCARPIDGLLTGVLWGCFLESGIGTTNGIARGGGLAFLQHVILRFFLWRAKTIPWNYIHFLDYASERILLRKVGTSYIFVHHLLLKHFASLEASSHLSDG